MKKQFIIAAALMGAAVAAQAADVVISNSISTSATWTSDNDYHLRGVIYVTPGATLTIEAGTTVIGYDDTENEAFFGAGSSNLSSALVIANGAQIFAEGTADEPITFTSDDDLAAGAWRPFNQEWGNLTILGDAWIADNEGDEAPLDSSDQMEGLDAAPGGLSLYGGINDDDNSGTLKYVSLRYGGSVIGTANELNGLSLGGIGRGTTIDYIEIMNNVDDGIEIWGGTVNLKHVSIWNIGDDSFDLDEGFRGSVQYVLIVQGMSDLAGTSGSGSGDNAFEMDGGEDPDNSRPYANPVILNATVIGHPTASDYGMSYRDNFRGQFHNCIFMDTGKDVMTFEKDFQAEMSNAFYTAVDTYVDPTDALFYDSSRSGNWSEITDTLIYNCASLGMLPTLDQTNGVDVVVDLPIVSYTRGPALGTEGYEIVTSLNPCAANDALTTAYVAPSNGFFEQTTYKGAFSADYNWLAGWTAADQYGMVDTSMNVGPAASLELGASISFQSVAGVQYAVESNDTLTSGVWTVVGSVVGDGSEMAIYDSNLPENRSYRVVVK